MKKITLALFLATTVAAVAQQVPLDTQFTTGTGPDESVLAVRQLADGKILIAGNFFNYNGNVAGRIARLNSDGTYDSSFTTNAAGPVEAMLTEEDGKFLITQSSGGGLYRYNADGTIDTSFTRITFGGYGPYRLVKQGDKYIVAGDFTIYSNAGVLYTNVARLNYDGTLDTTFAQTQLFNTTYVQVLAEPNGKIILAGAFSYFNNIAVPNIIRLNADGSLDTTFNAGTGTAGTIRGMAVQPDGKYIISGTFESFNGVAKHLNARLNTDGSLDTTFNYTSTIGLPEDGIMGYDIIVQPDGKILVGGMFNDAMEDIEGNPDGSVPVYLSRLNEDGSTDDTFIAPFDGTVFDLEVQDDGKLLVGGWFRNYDGQPQMSLARLDYNALNTTGFQKALFTMYPNPVTNILTIMGKDLNSANATVTVTDVLGKQIYSAAHNAAAMQVDMSGYNNGIYFIKIEANGTLFTQKILKN